MTSKEINLTPVIADKIKLLREQMNDYELDTDLALNMLAAFNGNENQVIDLWKKVVSKAQKLSEQDFYLRFGHVPKPVVQNMKHMTNDERQKMQLYLDAYNAAEDVSSKIFGRIIDEDFFHAIDERLYGKYATTNCRQ